jgi:positive regulator of sigma E activity
MKAKVIQKNGNTVQLEVIPDGSGCFKCGLCLFGGKKKCTLSLETEENVLPGDTVRIDYSEGRGTVMALKIFFIPTVILVLLAGAFIWLGYPEIISAGAGAAGVVLYFILTRSRKQKGISLVKE